MERVRENVPDATGWLAALARIAVLATSAVLLSSVSHAEPVPDYEYRTPRSEAELRDWLQNMVWHHRFTRDEIQAATGMPEAEIEDALKRLDIRPQTRPARAKDAPLGMLPWPGGRAVSDWGGEVERTRQRETKVSVFAPWDPTSYIVLDVPEAIWSNLGLVYLAHVDVPTIWTEQDTKLEKLEWNRRPDGGLDLARKLPNGIAYHAEILPTRWAIRMKLTLTNGTQSVLTGLRVQNCVFLKGLKGFENESQPQLAALPPYNACGTADAKRWVITAWVPGGHTWANPKNPCFHSDPTFEDCPPGETRTVHGWLSFYEGDDIQGELQRIDQSGWRSDLWEAAERRGAIYAECARNARQILQGWIRLKRDPETHLYSRGRTWNYANEAADHYSSLVLAAHYLDPSLNEEGGTLHETLVNSIRLCATPSGLPAPYNLKTSALGEVDVGGINEWLRDGLIRIVEVLGTENDWHRELQRLVDAMLAEAQRRGGMAQLVRGHEDRGNLLQTLARLSVTSGETRYIEAAEELADLYLLGDPIAAVGRVRLIDHGCELVPGLSELFVVESKRRRPKAEQYRQPLQQLLDRLLEVGRDPETGLWLLSVDLPSGRATGPPPDTFGYALFAFENYDRATGGQRYRQAIEKPVRWLLANRPDYAKHRGGLWPTSKSIDDWSDSYESMNVLWNRYRELPEVFAWLDWATHQGGHRRQRPDAPFGPGDGGHFDGSTARTLCAHMMLCSRGVRALPSPDGLRLGAMPHGDGLVLTFASDGPWQGKLCFDGPRTEHATATIDWARINEMPQWFVVRPDESYVVAIDAEQPSTTAGSRLIEGLELQVRPGQVRRMRITPQ